MHQEKQQFFSMKKNTVFILLLGSIGFVSQAQTYKKWTLKDCIAYAFEKNIQLQKSRLAHQLSETEVKAAKSSLFPSLSASSDQNMMNRPFQANSSTVNGSEIINSNHNTTYTGTYSLNLNWTIWNGKKNTLNIQQQEINRQMAELDVQTQSNTLQEEITKLYLQILYANESVKLQKAAVETSQATYERGKALFAQGSISKADLAQLESQLSNDNYTVVTAESAFRNYRFQLKQLLELNDSTDFNIEESQFEINPITLKLPTLTEVYETAVQTRPELLRSRLNIDYNQLGIKSAKAGYSPTISLFGTIGTSTNSSSPIAWRSQLKNGWNNMIGLSLSLPIFDNRKNKSNVERARIAYHTSQLDYASRQKELYAEIESIYLNATNSQAQYKAATAKVHSSSMSFELINEQFRLGMKNTVELLTEKNNLYAACQQAIQAKYMYYLNRTLLNLYLNLPIE